MLQDNFITFNQVVNELKQTHKENPEDFAELAESFFGIRNINLILYFIENYTPVKQ